MNYQETVQYLYAMLPMFQRTGGAAYKSGLDNIIALCEAMSNPQESLTCIHVAGTNGKGSSSHMLAAVMQTAGFKTGLYTSPHLKSFTERIRLNGREVPEDFVVSFVESNRAVIEQLKPSFFEFVTVMAFSFFVQNKVDIAIIETGMGGRLDSTNVVKPLVSLITNIGYDHMQFLGDTLPAIASEKAGIIKDGVPAVVSEYQPECAEVFIQKAKTSHTDLYFASAEWQIKPSARGFYVSHQDSFVIEELYCDLAGDYQRANIAGVLATLRLLPEKLKPSLEHIREGLAHTCTLTGLKGRWQILAQQPLTVCDTAHNEHGMSIVSQQIARQQYRKLHFVLGMVNDKEPDKVLQLLPQEAVYYFCSPNIPRGLEANLLKAQALLYNLHGECYTSVNEAFRAAQRAAQPDDMIFTGGSTFVVAELEAL